MEKDHEVIESRYTCIRCGKSCADNRGLSIHQNKCNVDPKYSCKYCKTICSSAKQLYHHESKCKAIRLGQLEIERLDQLQLLTKTIEDLHSSYFEQLTEKDRKYQFQLQEKDFQIQQVQAETQSLQKRLELKLVEKDRVIDELTRRLEEEIHRAQLNQERMKFSLEELSRERAKDKRFICKLTTQLLSR